MTLIPPCSCSRCETSSATSHLDLHSPILEIPKSASAPADTPPSPPLPPALPPHLQSEKLCCCNTYPLPPSFPHHPPAASPLPDPSAITAPPAQYPPQHCPGPQ